MTGSTSRNELRALARIPEAPARSLAVGERLARLGREGFTIAFDALAHGAARGHIEDVIAMLACARFFQRERASGPDRDLEAMRESARRAGLRFATAILEPASDARALGWRGRLRDVGGPSRLVRRGVLYIPPS